MNIKIIGSGDSRIGIRQITDKLFWLCHCLGDCADQHNAGFRAEFARIDPKLDPDAIDVIYAGFLFVDDKTLLLDNLSPAQHQTIVPAIEHVLGNQSLDYIWLSHVELPHAGNTVQVRRRYPDAKVMTFSQGDHYEIYGLEDAIRLDVGEKIDLGTLKLEIVKPLFVDHALTQWVYEHHTGFFCPVDWGHNLHAPKHCFHFMDEMLKSGYSIDQYIREVAVISRYTFPWLRWCESEKILAMIDQLFTDFDIRIFASCHGHIIRKDIDKFAEALKQAMHKSITGEFEIVY